MSTGHLKNIRGQSADEYRKGVKSYDKAHPFTRAIYEACAIDSWGSQLINALDAMSGPGKMGRTLSAMFAEAQAEGRHPMRTLRFTFNDIMAEPLAQLRADGYETIQCDVRELGKEAGGKSGKAGFRNDGRFHVIVARYGLKDLPEGHAELAIAGLHRMLVPGGRLVIADMYAPSRESQEAVIRVHAAKQELAGRDRESEGICFIPGEGQWERMLEPMKRFFPVKVFHRDVSVVDTRDWAGQFGPGARDEMMIGRMNRTILEASVQYPAFGKEFNVQHENGRVVVHFPIIVITADKL